MKRIIYTLLGMMLSVGAWAQTTLQEQINSASEATTIQLSGNVDLGATTLIIPADKNITIDLNGHNITSSASGAVAVKNYGTLTVKDTSGEQAGKIISTKHAGIGAGDNSTTTFESGNIESVEGAIITGKVVGATITINGGTLSASDNAVIMGNGSARDGNANTITINGGTFNGQIKSSGYVACGIYAPWKDVITVNGGTFNITGGCGVLARAGSVTINGGEFNCSGTATGKVGDSRVVVPCSAIVYDSQANYPAQTTESKVVVPSTSTAKFTADPSVAAVSVVGESHIEISGGTYSSPLTEDVCAEGYIPSNTLNADGTYGAVEGSYVAQIGAVKYASLAEAVTAATTGEIVKLIADENTTSQIEIAGKEITLDLNGHAVTYKGTTALKSGVLLVHNGAGLTVNATGGGAINSGENAYAAIALTKNGDDASSPAKLTINGGNITGYYYAITGHGSRPNTEITINGGTITATASGDSQGIYHPQDGKLTITGGTITAYSTAVEMRAGTLDILGGEFTATATEYSCNPNGSGTTTIGAAIAIAQHTTKKDINVTISGGTFTGVKAVNESNPQANDPAPHVVMSITDGTFHGDVSTVDVQNFISGGTFSSAVPEEYCADGFIPQDNGDGTYGVTEGTYVAQVGETKYTTITEALEAATDGQTITLLADIEIETIDLLIGKNVNRNDKKIFANTFTVIDGQPCNIPYPFTAKTATYSREVGVNVWGTVCLPFQLDKSDDYTLYTVTSIEGSTMTVTEADYSKTLPGESYIFHKNSAGSTISFETKTAWVIETGPVQNEKLVGTFSQQIIESGLSSIYFINGDKFHQAKASLTVPAYRAYINYSAPGAAPAVLQLVVDEESSAIADVAADLNGTQAIYDVNGRQLAAPQKGINIMKLANGKTVKLIIK